MQSTALSSGSKTSAMSTNGFSTEDDSRSGHDQVCCLIDSGEKCQRQAGNASYSKRIQNQARKLKLTRDEMSPHIYICDYHKTQIQNIRTKRKRKDSEDDQGFQDGIEELIEIDFYQMPVNTLRRYKRHFKLSTRPGLSKAQLADAVASHFKTIPVVEKETLQMFFYTTKTKRFDSKDTT
ncbi:histone deacetylase complex subunit sap30 homolog [Plakobranchus ocellatus]|uniref:Histone deacetylase complex subunit sap30 homolog n=1 Tax=Plakobranchus ocellatus TaxID=259542 RepID=A0AAV4APH5_9GAST|nr:histone deacetylase complex subunit sap30 homolog [Plakobranchus ocellatus]